MKVLQQNEMQNTHGGFLFDVVGFATALAGHLAATTLMGPIVGATGFATVTYDLTQYLNSK